MKISILNLLNKTAVFVSFALCCGCQLIDRSIPGYTSSTISRAKNNQKTEQEHRRRFQIEGDPESIRWLKANRLRQGMSRGDVNKILGLAGSRVLDQQRFIGKSNLYQSSDRVYKWGPDAKGHSHFLVFRDDRLVNYDPKEFQDD